MKKIWIICSEVCFALSVACCGIQEADVPTNAKSLHQYVLRDGMEYGYEVAISNDEKSGRPAPKIVAMYRYLGRKGDIYQTMLRNGEIRIVFECTKPCDAGTLHTFEGTQYVSNEVLRLEPDTLLNAVMSDAMNGYLEQSVETQNGKATSLWVDGESKRLITTDAF